MELFGEKISCSFAWEGKKVCFWLGGEKKLAQGKKIIAFLTLTYLVRPLYNWLWLWVSCRPDYQKGQKTTELLTPDYEWAERWVWDSSLRADMFAHTCIAMFLPKVSASKCTGRFGGGQDPLTPLSFHLKNWMDPFFIHSLLLVFRFPTLLLNISAASPFFLGGGQVLASLPTFKLHPWNANSSFRALRLWRACLNRSRGAAFPVCTSSCSFVVVYVWNQSTCWR